VSIGGVTPDASAQGESQTERYLEVVTAAEDDPASAFLGDSGQVTHLIASELSELSGLAGGRPRSLGICGRRRLDRSIPKARQTRPVARASRSSLGSYR
jgi:hypothetical protein